MEFNNIDIDNYKKRVSEEWLLKSVEDIKKEFMTDRICWAFVMWTYSKLNIFINSENSLKKLVKGFKRVEDGKYKFPDIVIFREKNSSLLLKRHAGIMLDKNKFVHLGVKCNGLQFTDLFRLPWSGLDKMIIRHNEIYNN
ncbi:MAG: C40 family peptidase [Gammaproteobacteria bacterium]|nr:C40 family peptidase [Gammaproteobacteria bacterium]